MSGIYQVYTIIINFLRFPDAWKQEPGGKSFRNAWIPTGPAPAYGRPGADNTIPGTARFGA